MVPELCLHNHRIHSIDPKFTIKYHTSLSICKTFCIVAVSQYLLRPFSIYLSSKSNANKKLHKIEIINITIEAARAIL